jgi:hypothetical protein
VIDRLGDDDHAYSFDWIAGKQYWFDIIHDSVKDPHEVCSREIRMVDPFGKVDSFAIPSKWQIETIRDLWRRVLEAPEE